MINALLHFQLTLERLDHLEWKEEVDCPWSVLWHNLKFFLFM